MFPEASFTAEQIREIVRDEIQRALKQDPAARKTCIIASKGTLDWAYPPLILSTAAAAANMVRSSFVASILRREGRDVRLVTGGMVDWNERGYPVEKGAAA